MGEAYAVCQDIRTIGQLDLGTVEGEPQRAREFVLEPRLVVRGSTGPSEATRRVTAESSTTRSGARPHASALLIETGHPKRQNGAMPSVQIKHVPERTHAVLTRRAAAAHQSLQEYLLHRLIEDAASPTIEEVFDSLAGQSGGSLTFTEAAEAIRADRDRR
jgi:carbon monoxide dehydrogenase subunit G